MNSTPHHILAVQVVQHGAEQLHAGLVVGFARVVVQLSAQLVGDERQQHISTVCGDRAEKHSLLTGSQSTFPFNGPDLTDVCVGVMLELFFSHPLSVILCKKSLCDFKAWRTPTWLPEKVTLHHLTHAAQLLTHELRVGNALDELGEENAENIMKEESSCDNLTLALHNSHLVIIATEANERNMLQVDFTAARIENKASFAQK